MSDLTGTQKVTVHNGRETQGANIHSKEVMTTGFFSFLALVFFFFSCCSLDDIHDDKQALQTGERTCTVTDQQTPERKKKLGQRRKKTQV